MADGPGRSDESCGDFRRRLVLGMDLGCLRHAAGRADPHGGQGDLRSRGKPSVHRRTAGRLSRAMLTSQTFERNHAVRFYESDDFLCDTVARFLLEGLNRDEPLLVVATAAH